MRRHFQSITAACQCVWSHNGHHETANQHAVGTTPLNMHSTAVSKSCLPCVWPLATCCHESVNQHAAGTNSLHTHARHSSQTGAACYVYGFKISTLHAVMNLLIGSSTYLKCSSAWNCRAFISGGRREPGDEVITMEGDRGVATLLEIRREVSQV